MTTCKDESMKMKGKRKHYADGGLVNSMRGRPSRIDAAVDAAVGIPRRAEAAAPAPAPAPAATPSPVFVDPKASTRQTLSMMADRGMLRDATGLNPRMLPGYQRPTGPGVRGYADGGIVRRTRQEPTPEYKYYKRGGKVRGPGGPTDDEVPAMLSNGEYVLPADTVKKVGVKKLDRLRKATHKPAGRKR
jgi:hypothetical protein